MNHVKINQSNNALTAKSIVRRRLLLSLGGTGIVSASMPTKWRKPVINSLIMPAHAQMSPRLNPTVPPTPPAPPSPQHQVARLVTEDRIPSGETTPVTSISEVRLRGCDLPANASGRVSATIELADGSSLALFTRNITASGGGGYTETVNIGVSPTLPVSEVSVLQLTIEFDGVTSNQRLNASQISSAVSGSVAPLMCS